MDKTTRILAAVLFAAAAAGAAAEGTADFRAAVPRNFPYCAPFVDEDGNPAKGFLVVTDKKDHPNVEDIRPGDALVCCETREGGKDDLLLDAWLSFLRWKSGPAGICRFARLEADGVRIFDLDGERLLECEANPGSFCLELAPKAFADEEIERIENACADVPAVSRSGGETDETEEPRPSVARRPGNEEEWRALSVFAEPVESPAPTGRDTEADAAAFVPPELGLRTGMTAEELRKAVPEGRLEEWTEEDGTPSASVSTDAFAEGSTVYVDFRDGKVSCLTLQFPFSGSHEPAARKLLEDTLRRLGAPSFRKRFDGPTGFFDDWIWTRGNEWLVLDYRREGVWDGETPSVQDDLLQTRCFAGRVRESYSDPGLAMAGYYAALLDPAVESPPERPMRILGRGGSDGPLSRLAKSIAEGDAATVAKSVRYPLGREIPIPPIRNEEEFVARFDEVFDEDFRNEMRKRPYDADWAEIGWRGTMYGYGQFWVDGKISEGGKIYAVNHQSRAEAKLRRKLVEEERKTLAPWLAEEGCDTVLCFETEDGKTAGRVDRLSGGRFRVALFATPVRPGAEPQETFYGPVLWEGTGGNHTYLDELGRHALSVNVVGPEGMSDLDLMERLAWSDAFDFGTRRPARQRGWKEILAEEGGTGTKGDADAGR